MSRVVLFPFSPGDGLAHVGACLAVGRRLRERGHEVICAYGGDLPEVVEREGFPVEHVPEMSAERAASGRWFEDVGGLLEHADADAALLERTRADAVVVDFRLSSSLAAERAGVRELELMHFVRFLAYWREPQPWRKRLRQARRSHRIPSALLELRRGRAGRDSLALWAEGRRRYGLPPAPPVEGDAVALTTTPLLDPTAGLPAHWHYTGPIEWSAGPAPEPIGRGDRPLVHVTQGSSGSADLLRRAVRELRRDDVDLLVTTASLVDPDELSRLAPHARVERLLPTSACLEAADVAVVHGGHLTTAEAHRLGTPVVVLPAGHDHWAWAERVERLGTGIALRQPLAPGAVRRAVRRILAQPRYRERVEVVASHLSDWDGARRSADLVETLLA